MWCSDAKRRIHFSGLYIAKNIIIKDDKPNIQQFDYAVQVANLKSFLLIRFLWDFILL